MSLLFDFFLLFFFGLCQVLFVSKFIKVINLALRIKGGIFGTYMNKGSLVLAGYSAVRRNSGCSISAPLTLLQIPAWNFFFSSPGMGIKYHRKDFIQGFEWRGLFLQKASEDDWTDGCRMSVFILRNTVNTCLSACSISKILYLNIKTEGGIKF